jgi:hypothetical protein
MDRDYSYFMDKNNDDEEQEKFPLAIIQVYADGSLSVAGRDDMTMREVAALLHIMSHDMMENLEAREKKAMEN